MRDYKALINKKDLPKLSKRKVKNLNLKDETLSFQTDEKNIRELITKIENIKYYHILKTKLKALLKKYLISIIAFFIIIILLINQNISVREIKFLNYDTYNEEVEAYLKTYLKKVGPFYYLNSDLNSINYDLKNKFYDYEWIGVDKRGAILEVKIKKQGEEDYHNFDEGVPGDFFAKKDAIIIMYYIQKGVVLVQDMQSVTKGDLLVTGNLKHHIGESDYIRPKGIIIGETLEYQNIMVKKIEEKMVKTGKVITKNHLVLFNLKLKDKVKYSNYEKEVETIFKLGNIIKLESNSYYEVQTVKTIYNYEEALEYAKSKIQKDFKKSSKYEMIKFINLIAEEETNDYFLFRFIVKKHENIVEFRAVS